jgi:hypothetical protein
MEYNLIQWEWGDNKGHNFLVMHEICSSRAVKVFLETHLRGGGSEGEVAFHISAVKHISDSHVKKIS